MTAVLVSGPDTLMARVFKAHVIFEDTAFSHRYTDNYNVTLPPYSSSGTYERINSLVYFDDTTTYPDAADRSLTPIPGEPYTPAFGRNSLVLLWTHDYGGAVIRTQRFALTRTE